MIPPHCLRFGRKRTGNLREYGVTVKAIPSCQTDGSTRNGCSVSLTVRTRMVAFQRSCGYEDRRSFAINDLVLVFAALRRLPKPPIIFVDNCSGNLLRKKSRWRWGPT